MKQPLSKRQAILEAAAQVVLAEGVMHLTLDAVAQRAGVSKGGLLYHFPSKEALIAEMIDRLAVQFSLALDEELARDGSPATPGSWLRAYIRVTFAPDQQLSTLTAGLLAAVASNPALLEPLRKHFLAWQQRAEQSGLDPALATAIRLAVDGLWFTELLGLAPPAEPLRAQVAQALIALTEGRS